MTVKKIGVGCNVGAQIDGTQHAALVAATWIKKPDIMIMQDRSLGDADHYINMIEDVIVRLQTHVKDVLEQHDFPLIIGGDHAIVMGSLPYKENTLVVWIDAHADVNTPETTLTHRIHGMPMAALMGYGDERLLRHIHQPFLTPDQVVFYGVRDMDLKEEAFVNDKQMLMLDHHQPIEETLDVLLKKAEAFDRIHISFDMDSFDPDVVPGVSTPVPDGISIQQAKRMLKALFKTNKVVSMDIVEFNPLIETRLSVNVLKQLVDLVELFQH